MLDFLIAIICLIIVIMIFFRRWYLLEKGSLFGKMVLKKGLKLPSRLNKEDVEITAKEMIPDVSQVDPKLRVKGENFYKKAELELKRGHISEAEKFYIKAIAMDPSHIESHAKLGTIYLNQEQFGKAELIFRKLILAVADEATYFSNLALSLFQQEKYAEAKTFYERTIEIDPTRAGRFYSLAMTNYQLKETEDAFKNLEKALSMDADNLDYGLTLAHWYIEKGLNQDAEALLENISLHWPENHEAKQMIKDLKKS
jgi:tetratricopeptide (TPR) repeat protein